MKRYFIPSYISALITLFLSGCKPQNVEVNNFDDDYRAVENPHSVPDSEIRKWINSSDTEDVTRAYYVVQKTEDKEWINTARIHITNDEFYIRINAALYLGMLGDEKSVPVLQEIVKSDKLRRETKNQARNYIERISESRREKGSGRDLLHKLNGGE